MVQNASSRGQPAARQRAALDGWLSSQASPNTRAAYRSDLELFGKWCTRQGAVPLTADTATLVSFQAAREAAGDSPSTIRRRWSALSSFYDFAIERDLRSVNPSVGVDRPKVSPGDPSPTMQLSDEAVASYRATAAALDPRLDALVALLVCEGLKVSEALDLDIEDVAGRSPATTITVRRRGEVRRIVLDRESARALRGCIGKRRTGPVFVSEKASRSDAPRRLTRFGADHLIRQLRTGSAVEPVTANALRRFHITTRRLAGDPVDDVRDRAGLASARGVRRFLDATADVGPRSSSKVAGGLRRRTQGSDTERSG
ncbi:MAG: site-specific integrase [Actinomycetota bacterium]|nr:site-specific integrase [Actinomycetota bacterium]